jgi:SAM-dependent methyltransferase
MCIAPAGASLTWNGMSDVNRATWQCRGLAREYARANTLYPAELFQLNELKEVWSTARVLDLGVGAGRTTAYLKDRCSCYVGIDLSTAMIAVAKERFPDLDLRQMDATDLSCFDDNEFDVVLFSFNGIDYANHENRIKILREVHRVLKPGSHFLFSTHNRHSRVCRAHHLRNFQLSSDPSTTLRNFARYVLGILNSAKLRRFEKQERQYAVLNDRAHEYRLLTYYIFPKDQFEQLEECGFRNVLCLEINGMPLKKGSSSQNPWLHYSALK